MPTQIAASGSLAALSTPDIEGIYTMSNGALVALYEVSGVGHYAVSTDSGATWPSTYSMPSGWAGLAHIVNITQIGDVLHVWSFTSSSITRTTFAFTAGANTLGAGVAHAMTVGATNTHTALAVGYDATNAVWFAAVAYTDSVSTHHVIVRSSVGTSSTWAADDEITNRYSGVYALRITVQASGTGANVTVTFADSSGGLLLCPVLASAMGSGLTDGALETVYTASSVDWFTVLDAAGRVQVVIRDGTSLYARVRTGTNSYSAIVPVATAVDSGTHLAYANNTATGELLVLYRSNANQPNGELYGSRRGTAWSNPGLVAGGDTAGYTAPAANHAIVSSVAQVLYMRGAALEYAAVPVAGAPSKPTITTPIGNVGSLTPPITAPYVNASPGDPMGAYQIQVQTDDGVTTMWDSGQVTASNSTNIPYGGSALSWSTAYRARIRQWDTLSAGGAGTASPWSDWVTFTPKHSPVATITSLSSGGTAYSSSPASIGSPYLGATVNYTQSDSDTASSARLRIYQTDGVTLVGSGTVNTFSPLLAAGASFTLAEEHYPQLANSHAYKVGVEITDSVTGVVLVGPLWTVNTSWTPPPSPGSFVVTPNNDAGTVSLSWTLDVTATSVIVSMRPVGGTWTVVDSGNLDTSIILRPPPLVPYEYQVVAVNALGILSVPTSSTATLGLRGGMYGIWLTSVDNHTLSVALGMVENFSVLKRSHQDRKLEFVPAGSAYPKTWYDNTNYYRRGGVVFTVLDTYPLGDGSLAHGADDVAVLRQIAEQHLLVQWRDPRGLIVYGEVQSFEDEPLDDTHTTVYFVFLEKALPAGTSMVN